MANSSSTNTTSPAVQYGVIPRPIFELMSRLREKVARADAALQSVPWQWNEQAHNREPFMVETLAASQRCIDAATDLRALMTAYGQVFHDPKPLLVRLARAQRASSAGLVKRYTPNHVEAIDQLLSRSPDVGRITKAFRTVAREDLFGLTSEIDKALSIQN